MTSGGEMTPPPAGFFARLESRYKPPAGAVILEDPAVMVRLPLINGSFIVANAVFLATLLFLNGEPAVGWTVVVLGLIYVVAILGYIITGSADLNIHLMLWPSLVQNVAAHIMLGGFIWSGAVLFFGIIVSVVAALFLGRLPGVIIAGSYLVGAVVLGFLEPTLQASRAQPALTVSVVQAVDVLVMSILTLVPIIALLMSQITRERARSEQLLLNVLPRRIADRLKRSPGLIADAHEECTVLFADLVSFTDHTTRVSPGELITELNLVFSRFDGLVEACGAEKIKTMGDGYLAVAGAPTPRPDHAEVICEVALLMRDAMPAINEELGSEFKLRIGIATGPLIAGVVGTNRFSYDLWGGTVNLASRMETLCPPGAIQVTGDVARSAGEGFEFERYQTIDVKGIGETATCLLVGTRGR